jgi:hypothetical protein
MLMRSVVSLISIRVVVVAQPTETRANARMIYGIHLMYLGDRKHNGPIKPPIGLKISGVEAQNKPSMASGSPEAT